MEQICDPAQTVQKNKNKCSGWSHETQTKTRGTQRLRFSGREDAIFTCLATLPQAQFNSDGISDPNLLEPEVLYVLAPPFFSGPSAEGPAVCSHGKKRCSLHWRKRNQTPSAGGASSRGLNLFPPPPITPTTIKPRRDESLALQNEEKMRAEEVRRSSFPRSLTSWRCLRSAFRV